jgi:hypothetical protein
VNCTDHAAPLYHGVQGPGGERTTVPTKRLVAIKPTLPDIAALDMDEAERAVFAKPHYSAIYTGIVTHPALPANTSLVNLPPAAAPANALALSALPLSRASTTSAPRPEGKNLFCHHCYWQAGPVACSFQGDG